MSPKGELDNEPQWDNHLLLASIVEGDKSAEQLLVNRYWRSLYFILTHRTQDPELAKDIAQDTFIAVLLNIRRGKVLNPDALGKYIRETGCNLLIGHYRKQSRRKTDSQDNLECSIIDDSPNLYRLLYSKQGVEIVTQLLNELEQKRDKEILMAFFLYGKEKQQICADWSLSCDNFDKVLHRARERLKQIIAHRLENGHSELTAIEPIVLIFIIIMFLHMIDDKKLKKNVPELEGKAVTSHLYAQGVVTNQLHRQVNMEIRG